jgi:hypothetical protein
VLGGSVVGLLLSHPSEAWMGHSFFVGIEASCFLKGESGPSLRLPHDQLALFMGPQTRSVQDDIVWGWEGLRTTGRFACCGSLLSHPSGAWIGHPFFVGIEVSERQPQVLRLRCVSLGMTRASWGFASRDGWLRLGFLWAVVALF